MLTLWEHLRQLRHTLIGVGTSIVCGALISFVFHRPLLHCVLAPVTDDATALLILSPLDGFLAALKVSFWAGFLLSSPVWLGILLRFVLPALKAREKRAVLPLVVLGALLLFGGLLFAYFLTLPVVTRFFRGFNAGLGVQAWSLTHLLAFSLHLLLAHALAFELFGLLLVLVHVGLIAPHHLNRARPYALVSILVASAVLTPPDVLSQLLLALPLVIFYECCHLYALMRKRTFIKN